MEVMVSPYKQEQIKTLVEKNELKGVMKVRKKKEASPAHLVRERSKLPGRRELTVVAWPRP